MNLFRAWLSLYSWRYPTVIVYMLQTTEYQPRAYLAWYWQTNDFSRVMHRRALRHTRVAKLLLMAAFGIMGVGISVGLTAIAAWHFGHWTPGLAFGLAAIAAYPIILAHIIVLPLVLGRWLVIQPRERKLVRASAITFKEMQAAKIAVAGSYGKTSMKELLLTVLGEGKKVAATPANKNVAISHALFARKLQGDEDVVIIEYGEGAPGDVARFAATTHPTHAIITGLAPAHLDHYKTLAAAGKDIFSVADALPADHVFVNTESRDTEPFMQDGFMSYSEAGALGWRVHDIKIGIDGTKFTLKKGKKTLHVHSGLLGRHQIGPLSLAAALGDHFGLTPQQIEAGVARTLPFEHRMQPYVLSGAWIIDDTYNGNIEGIRAGTALLKELPGKRKIYITPGLVDQGIETERVHTEMGRLIAAAQPDIVVLMQHSVTPFIKAGLKEAGFAGKLLIEHDPLHFYQNLSLFVATGDVVLMQNDWPDNYR